MATICDKCGAQTDIPELFISQRKSFQRSFRTECPSCHESSQLGTHKGTLIWTLGYGVLGFGALLIWPDDMSGPLLVNLFLFNLLLFVLILPHELGHAFAAKLVGFQVFKIDVGYGKTLYKTKIFGIPTEFKAFPVGGFAFASPVNRSFIRVKQFLFVLAGPLANLLLGAAMFLVLPVSDAFDFSVVGARVSPAHLLLYANLLLLIFSLWPCMITTPLGQLASDGLALLKIPFYKKEMVDNLIANRHLQQSLEHYEKEDYQKALEATESGLAEFPDHTILINLRGIMLLSENRVEQAKKCFVQLLAYPDIPPLEHALNLNNIAYINCLLGGDELLAEADEYSKQAMSALEWLPAVKGTRGTVLLEQGQIDEAMPLLLSAMTSADTEKSKAQSACFLAIAEARLGNVEKSCQYIDEAEKLDPECLILDRAKAEHR